MLNVLKLMGVCLLTLAGLVVFTRYDHGAGGAGLHSVSHLLGWPVVSIAQKGARGIVAIGQVGAVGVLTVAQVGGGVVAFVQAGVGLLFSVGQLAFSLVLIGQVGVGLLFFLGQIGVGVQALGQAAYRNPGGSYFKEMHEELSAIFAFRSR